LTECEVSKRDEVSKRGEVVSSDGVEGGGTQGPAEFLRALEYTL
jgi:hypothetical protein